jgi:hypothetical protein
MRIVMASSTIHIPFVFHTSPCLNLFSCHVLEKNVSLVELNIEPKLEMRDTKGEMKFHDS